MTTQIRCESCEIVLLAFEALEPQPIGQEECPRCGETAFTFVTNADRK